VTNLEIALTILTVANATATLLLISKTNKMAQSFEEMQATIDAANTALDNIAEEMGDMKTEIDDLKAQIANMGLDAEQERIISEGLSALRERAESISTKVEGSTGGDEAEA
jgi:uncharacterized coiled-coil DUF342 family protein